jgi:putative tricarboxylic transport membrane protein
VTLRHPDAIGAIAIAVLAVIVLYGGVPTPDPGFGVVSPGTFPTILGVLMLGSAAWVGLDARGKAPTELEAIDRRPFALTVIATGAFLAAFVPLGFLISATLFLIAEAWILGSRHTVRDVIASVLFIGALYVLFVKFLTIDLPRGPLPPLF